MENRVDRYLIPRFSDDILMTSKIRQQDESQKRYHDLAGIFAGKILI